MTDAADPKLPAGFVLGAATSSYQIEGYGDDGRGASIWDVFCTTPGKIVDGSDGSVACQHLSRWPQDLDLVRDLGFGAYRFSVAWPRVLPEGTGRVNERGLAFYDRLVDGLLERGIAPYMTLYHWDLPQALEDRGGWTARDIAVAFADYAEIVASRLGDRVSSIATLNEPWCSAFLGYLYGEHAPGIHGDRDGMASTIHHLLLGHGLAMQRMRSVAPRPELGIVLNFTPGYAATQGSADIAAAARHETANHDVFVEPLFGGGYPAEVLANLRLPIQEGDMQLIESPIDFLGINYYTRCLLVDDPQGPWPNARSVPAPAAPHTAMRWEVYPTALEDLLVRLSRRTRVPLFVTENGAAYDDPDTIDGSGVADPERTAYYREHISAVLRAAQRGADVRGYFAWSLLDNFEWAYGYSKRFGIVHVDYATQVRTPKDSAKWLSALSRAR